VSNNLQFHQHARRELDRAIHHGYAALAGDPAACDTFTRLLALARERSTLLRPRGAPAPRCDAVRALANLARHHGDHRVPCETWQGGDAGVHELVHSLVEHLLAHYPVPRWFGVVWFGGDEADRAEQRWFVAHAAGRRFRDIDGLPVQLTRRMEHILLTMPPQRSLRAAIRRAEVLGLGGPPELADTLLETDLGGDLEHGEFWRSAIHFFIHHRAELGAPQIKAIVDYLYAVRIRTTEVATDAGVVALPPPHPEFSLAGRTPQSLRRLVDAWHVELGARRQRGRSWPASGMRGCNYLETAGEESVRWRIEELCQSGELQDEGRALRHCVASYEYRCVRGTSSIWSLRRQDGEEFSPRFTIEVDPRTRTIVQIRGHHNQLAVGLPRRIVALWAQQERLTIAQYA
jgi:hypothetical protein